MNDPNSSAFLSNIIGDRYQIERVLADKDAKKTLLVTDLETEALVVIKLLIFNGNFSWDKLRLFEREAQTLQALSHPAIPQYLDYFEVDTEEFKGFALVESYIDALSLGQQIQTGRLFTEGEVKQLATAILEILEYLHSHQPAIVHRDIKPSNILLTNRSGNSIGQVYLIDFGSVHNFAVQDSSTITVVGTYGYMPPEQFGGRVRPASDLYSLGATLIYIVTGQHPAELPETDLRIEFEEFCQLSPGFTAWLKHITNPSLSGRIVSASEALEKLAECENYLGEENRTFIRPPSSKICLRRTPDSLEVILPGKKYVGEDRLNLTALLVFCFLPWIIPLIALLMNDISLVEIVEQLARYFGILLISAILAAGIGYILLKPSLTTENLSIDPNTIILSERLSGFTQKNYFFRARNALSSIGKTKIVGSTDVYVRIDLYFGSDKYELVNTNSYPVDANEIDWLAEELSIYLNVALVETNTDERVAQQVDLYLRQAYDLYNQKNYAQAIEYFNLAIQLDSQAEQAYLYRAISYFVIGDYQSAVEDSYLVLSLNPESTEAYCRRGAAFCCLEDYHSAKKDLNRALELNPEYQEAHYYLAAVELNLENYTAALEICDRALEINDQYAYAYFLKGKVYLKLNNHLLAIENCDRAFQLNSKLTEVYSLKGRAYCYLGNYEAALFYFAGDVQQHPSGASFYNFAVTQFASERYSEALESVNSCLELDDSFTSAYYVRANINHQFNHPQFATQDFQRAVQLEADKEEPEDTQDEHGYYARGLARYQINGDRSGAIEDLEKAKEIAAEHQYQDLIDKAIALLDKINQG